MKMSTRDLCRIFGITLVTWSIVIQSVSCIPLAVPIPQEIQKKNVTDNGIHIDHNVSLSTEIQKTTDNKKVNDATTTPYFKASAVVTALPTSEYVELTSIDNITSLSENIKPNATTIDLEKPKDNVQDKKQNQLYKIREANNPEEKITTEKVNANTTASYFNDSTTSEIGTTNSKSDIVSVLDTIKTYDSLLTNFMNDKIAYNTTEELSNNSSLSTNSTTPETTPAQTTSPNWKKYNTIVRKRTTKTMSETPIEVTTLKAVIKNTTTPGIQNITDKLRTRKGTENNVAEETLNVVASTWNRTNFLATATNATEVKSENYTTPMTTTDKHQTVLDEAESGVLASKRSGYLDNSKWEREIYITTSSPEIESENLSLENDFKLNSTAMSRQQMIEDALIEEHFREIKAGTEQTTTDVSPTDYQNMTINSKQNASINPLLYRVNSNYKPLKKLDVQPHKSFTIDPDDNSWRNESIHSRGIVYKPKNSSKPFTQVLKNKTESEWHNMLEKEFKDEEVELKERLEKIAAKRKSKKKLIGDVNNNETWNSTEMHQEDFKSTTLYMPVFNQILFTTNSPIDESSRTGQTTDKSQYDSNAMLTEKPMEHLNNADAYDSYDEDDRFMTEFDLMKTTQATPKMRTPSYPQKAYTQTEKTTVFPHYTTHYPPNRKGTIEYFPPKATKVNYNNYDFQFKNKVNTFTNDFMRNRIEPLSVLTTTPRVPQADKRVTEPSVYMMPPYETKLGDVEDSSYVIKHYKDFVSKAAAEALHPPSPHVAVVHKFVDSFNRNSEKLKEEFPILYNTNIVHRGGDDGRIVASSSAYLRRLHGSPSPPLLDRTNKYDPTCQNHTVELSPAYELHYFVNDEEQKQTPVLDPPIYTDFS